jgi:D-alanine-D-alanine ligase
MRVALLAGGRSSEHDVSLSSAGAVRAGVEEAGHEAVWIDISREGRWTCEGEPVRIEPAGGVLGADVVFPVLHGPFGEDGTVQGLLELADVPYVGAGVMASAVSMDKIVFKELMAQAGLPQVGYEAMREGDDAAKLEPLGLPVFVKPARLGSSVGISKVEQAADLPGALREAFAHDPLAIVEQMAGGMEIECSVIGNGDPIASQPGQIVLTSADWYDYEAKYTPGGMELVCPAPLDPEVSERVRSLAIDVYRQVDCAGFARVDFFVEDDGTVLVNELNTIPGFTPTSGFPKMFEASGIPFAELVDRLLQLAVERFESERAYRR